MLAARRGGRRPTSGSAATKLRALTARRSSARARTCASSSRLGGLHATSSSPWAGAPITSKEEVERARDLVDDLATAPLDPLLDALELRQRRTTACRPPRPWRDWAERLALWTELRATLDLLRRRVFDETWRPLAEQLAPLRRGCGARYRRVLGDGEYRAATARQGAAARRASSSARRACSTACAPRPTSGPPWARAPGAGGAPRPPEDLDELLTAHAAVSQALGSSLACSASPPSTARARRSPSVCARLRADVATLGRLPDLHRLARARSSAPACAS